MELNAEQIIRGLECCASGNGIGACESGCPLWEIEPCPCIDEPNEILHCALALIKQLTEEKCNLEYTLLGVMHSVDKWLDGADLEQDEVNRAATMREKTLQIVEKLTAENEKLTINMNVYGLTAKRLAEENEDLKAIAEQYQKQFEEAKADTVREMQERIKTRCIKSGIYPAIVARAIDQVAKEMTEEEQ